MNKASLLALLAMLSLMILGTGSVQAQVAGTYISSQRVDGGSIIYTLVLDTNGLATLTTEQRGNITVNRQTVNQFGNILLSLDRYGRAVHTGIWRQRGTSVQINLDTLRLDGSVDRVNSSFAGTFRNNSLTLSSFDRNLYGSRTRLVFDRTSVPGGGGGGPGAIFPQISVFNRSLAGAGGGTLTYTLFLHPNGEAQLVSSRTGQPAVTQGTMRTYGDILGSLCRFSQVTHNGRWSLRGTNITINLDTLVYPDRRETFRDTMTGRILPGFVVIDNFNRDLYGNLSQLRFVARR